MTTMVSDTDNATMFPETGGNSNNTTSTVTLEGLNAAELQRLVPTIVYLAVLSVAGMLGNSLVCHVYRTRYRLSNSQCFILCLSAIDLFSCAVVIPLEIATVINQYMFEHLWLCKLSRFFNTLSTLSASFLLLFIAIDRYRKVCRPFGWQIKANVAKFLCVLSVIMGIVVSWPAIFIYGKQIFEIPKYGLTGTECSTDDSMLKTIFPLINAAVFGGLFIVGIISICILYCFIGREVHKHAQRMPKELSVRNPSVPMLSSTTDARNSRVSVELDPKAGNKYDGITANREAKLRKSSKRTARQRDSESSWTDRKDFELSCSMDCSVKDVSVVSETEPDKTEDIQSDDSGIKSDQTNKDENEEIVRNASTENNEHSTGDEHTQDGVIERRHNVENCNAVNVESPRVSNCLETVKEHETDGDAKYEEGIDHDTSVEEIPDFVENNNSRKMSELSYTSVEIIIKPKNLRSRLSSIGSRISTAVIRRMTSLVSATSAGSMSVVKTQYLKQARARKTAFLMFLISLAFVLSYMPHLLLMIVRQLRDSFVENMTDDGRAVYKFFLRSYFLNCAINPVIYGVCDTRFRTACKEIFSRCCHRGEVT